MEDIKLPETELHTVGGNTAIVGNVTYSHLHTGTQYMENFMQKYIPKSNFILFGKDIGRGTYLRLYDVMV